MKDLFGNDAPEAAAEPSQNPALTGAGSDSPLAARLRPDTLAGFVGQQHLIGEGQILHRVIQSGQVHSMLFWGPPGVGKTTLALIIASAANCDFARMSAVTSGVKELRQIIAQARHRREKAQRQTVLFLDEIHRFSKSQQDALLPHVENGDITLIGATTENPSFEVISPLLSRSRVYVLQPLTEEDLRRVLDAAVEQLRGSQHSGFSLTDDAAELLLHCCQGDARTLINSVENACAYTGGGEVSGEAAAEVVQQSARYYRDGEAHYDTISAFIKSIRASDPDAAVYYLARMLDGGEDPLFIARRLIVSAAEDIGLADPQALTVAVSAQQAASFVGLPEARIPLSEATIYLATAPKSNSAYRAIGTALDEAKETQSLAVPMHLRNAPTGLMKSLGYGKGYEYAHNSPDAFVGTNNLPPELKDRQYYLPEDRGAEAAVKERLQQWRSRRRAESASDEGQGVEED